MVIQMTRAEYEQKYGQKPMLPEAAPQTFVGKQISKLENNVVEGIKHPLQRLQSVTPSRKDMDVLTGRAKDLPVEEKQKSKDNLLNFALSFDGGQAPKKLSHLADEAFHEVLSKRPGLENVQNVKQKISRFFSADADQKTSKILQEVTPEKFDHYVDLAKKAVEDPRNISPFEHVGDKIADITRQIDQQAKSLSQQKKQIISKAKTGLGDFSKEIGGSILDVRRALPDSKVGQSVINKLKTAKTKVDADNVIDDIQDMLYKGNEDKTIPEGSMEDKTLKGLLGKLNGKLKESLPPAYGQLNTKISDRINIVRSLNKALGEKVDGVSTRGAGLIKQFFSPSGRKAKELFEYIKGATGEDLSHDTILSKFSMEMFDDPRAKSLLEGIPSSAKGVLQKGVDMLIEKTGTGRKIQDALRDAQIQKARDLTKKVKGTVESVKPEAPIKTSKSKGGGFTGGSQGGYAQIIKTTHPSIVKAANNLDTHARSIIMDVSDTVAKGKKLNREQKLEIQLLADEFNLPSKMKGDMAIIRELNEATDLARDQFKRKISEGKGGAIFGKAKMGLVTKVALGSGAAAVAAQLAKKKQKRD